MARSVVARHEASIGEEEANMSTGSWSEPTQQDWPTSEPGMPTGKQYFIAENDDGSRCGPKDHSDRVEFATRKSRLKIYRSGVMESQGRIGVVLADDNPDILSVVRSTLSERFHIVAAVDEMKTGDRQDDYLHIHGS
jgi:hypothetical protein